MHNISLESYITHELISLISIKIHDDPRFKKKSVSSLMFIFILFVLFNMSLEIRSCPTTRRT